MAGATLGLALASAGMTAILVDPAPFDAQLAPTFDGRSSAIAYASFRQWKALGAAPDLEPHAQRIEQILVTDGTSPGAAASRPGSAFLRFDSAEIGDVSDGEPLGYMLENRRIRAALGAAVERSDKLTVLAPMKVVSLEVTPAAARVTLSDG
ncbi:MAG: Ubiquinone biosynthesis hydroxylase, UbiH/UbiF/VisC/COQ6 family, partial [Caulobacter sp.]|nr:Ubiquinone biosynthesis hydroxylase, UbiH/UbiF/VisC/COQ6 family [Caulobacter sp.]